MVWLCFAIINYAAPQKTEQITDVKCLFYSVTQSSTDNEEQDSIDRKFVAQDRRQDALEEDDECVDELLNTPSKTEELSDDEPMADDIRIPFFFDRDQGSVISNFDAICKTI